LSVIEHCLYLPLFGLVRRLAWHMANKPNPNFETCPEHSLRFGFELFQLFELLICIYLSIFCYIILQLAPKTMCIANIDWVIVQWKCYIPWKEMRRVYTHCLYTTCLRRGNMSF